MVDVPSSDLELLELEEGPDEEGPDEEGPDEEGPDEEGPPGDDEGPDEDDEGPGEDDEGPGPLSVELGPGPLSVELGPFGFLSPGGLHFFLSGITHPALDKQQILAKELHLRQQEERTHTPALRHLRWMTVDQRSCLYS